MTAAAFAPPAIGPLGWRGELPATLPWAGRDADRPATLIAGLARNALRDGDRVAFRERDQGIWQEHRWRDVLGDVLSVVILVLEQTRHLGVNLIDQLAPLAAAALLLEVAGPLLTWLALAGAREIPVQEER